MMEIKRVLTLRGDWSLLTTSPAMIGEMRLELAKWDLKSIGNTSSIRVILWSMDRHELWKRTARVCEVLTFDFSQTNFSRVGSKEEAVGEKYRGDLIKLYCQGWCNPSRPLLKIWKKFLIFFFFWFFIISDIQ